MRIQERQL